MSRITDCSICIYVLLFLATSCCWAKSDFKVGVDDAHIYMDSMQEAVLFDIGFEFIDHHTRFSPEEISRIIEWANQHKVDFLINQEGSPSTLFFKLIDPVSSGRSGYCFQPPRSMLDQFESSPYFRGFVFDELDHWAFSGLGVSRGLALPHLCNADGANITEAYDGYISNLTSMMSLYYPGYADNARAKGSKPAVYGEQLFPVMQHVLARAGMVPCGKLLKEQMTPVVTAMQMGAAKQYHLPYRTMADLFGPSGIGPDETFVFPDHNSDELRSVMLFAFWTGAENIYIEQIKWRDHRTGIIPANHHAMYIDLGDGKFELTPHGQVIKDFIAYKKATTRHIRFEDFHPQNVIVRYEDTDYGQIPGNPWCMPWLYGAPNLSPNSHTRYWNKIWNLLSHGAIPEKALNWENWDLSKAHKDGSFPFRFWFPGNSIAVYDHLASDPDLYYGTKAIFLAGTQRLPKETMDTISMLVREQGKMVITPSWLAPADKTIKPGEVCTTYKDGAGKWLVTDRVNDPAVKKILNGYCLGSDSELRYDFGDYEVIFTNNGSHPDYSYIEVTERLRRKDTCGPSGTIAVDSTKSPAIPNAVTLALSADDPKSGVKSMRFSNDGKSWSVWEAYSTTRVWTTSDGEGPKTVCVQYKDGSGNISPTYKTVVNPR